MKTPTTVRSGNMDYFSSPHAAMSIDYSFGGPPSTPTSMRRGLRELSDASGIPSRKASMPPQYMSRNGTMSNAVCQLSRAADNMTLSLPSLQNTDRP
ncbi:hypothetical protein SeLEV6574_g03269 [Synchytrium endobioticum]|uniref:Uncharacterized protein n=1 Tax=Synchytrium endobioticum TaxID=286115 RepID=A0A507D4G4_9FUNG|nr:hypothetical protein SeLEV6574_g03269 [Synchytrium endobioticum]